MHRKNRQGNTYNTNNKNNKIGKTLTRTKVAIEIKQHLGTLCPILKSQMFDIVFN